MKAKGSRNIVIIMGMHRSGTSCLAGCLQEMGLFLGDVVTSAPHNKKGNRENKDIYLLHEKVLESRGGSWDKPIAVNSWDTEHIDELKKVIQAYSRYPQWGFKDPRVLFTLQGWVELLSDYSFTFLASFRHPAKVAASLQRRNSFTYDEGLALWMLYNKQLLSLMDLYPVKLINFDLDEESYKKNLKALALEIENPGNYSGRLSFYENNLINECSQNTIPREVEEIYQLLLDRSMK